MPRAFNEREREIITHRLLQRGEELFSRFGLRKTNVEDIARAAGVSKGSFYSFFTSKEQLFFRILNRIQARQRERILQVALQDPDSPAQALKQIIRDGFQLFERYPFMRLLLEPEEFDQLLRGIPPAELEQDFQDDQGLLTQIMEAWNGELELIVEPAVAVGLLRALFFLKAHEKQIAPGVSAQVLDTFVELIANSIFREKGSEP